MLTAPRRQGPMLALSAGLLLATGVPALQQAKPDSTAPPSAAETRTQVERALANLHRDDEALSLYERVERTEERERAGTSPNISVQVCRVFPAGPAQDRIPLGSDGKASDMTAYVRELRDIERQLEWDLQDGSAQREAYARFAKRQKQRYALLEATRDAYVFTWAGREMRGGRTLDKLRLDPNPAYRPRSRWTAVLAKARGVAWVDEATSQLVHFEAELLGDVTLWGGIVAKVNKGGRFVMDRAEVLPGVWLPVLYQYDFDGRKFLFSYGVHEKILLTGFQHVGPPGEAIRAVRAELNNLAASQAGH
jgi:hypothetical protein